MKPLITLRSYLNRSLIRKCLLASMLIWIALQLPFVYLGYQNQMNRQRTAISARQIASEKVFLSLLESLSRFGDLVSAKGQVLQLGGQSGLKGLTICDENQELLGKFSENGCAEPAKSNFGAISFNGKLVEVRFKWIDQNPKIDSALIFTWLSLSITSLFIILGSSLFTYQLIQKRLSAFSRQVSLLSPHEELAQEKIDLPEIKELISSVVSMRSKIKQSHQLEIENLSLKVFSKMAKQVAHDIRSPLFAINAALSGENGLHPKRRDLLLQASRRINGIAEELLIHSRSEKSTSSARTIEPQSPLKPNVSCYEFKVGPSIKQIASEMTQAYPEISITFDDPDNDSTVTGCPKEFERILANLLQNSVDAIKETEFPQIKIAIRNYSAKTQIMILDNGVGIPPEVITRVGEEGFSFGKTHGNGLGLSFAKRKMQDWGGELKISSNKGIGTLVTLNFEKTKHLRNQNLNSIT
jgi:signal transduction histidine kinase